LRSPEGKKREIITDKRRGSIKRKKKKKGKTISGGR